MDAIASTAAGEGIKLAFSESLEVVTPDQAAELLKAHGVNLVSSGHGKLVQHYISLLNYTQNSQPVIQLVLGYSSFNLGDYHAARSQLGRALAGKTALAPFEGTFLEHLLNTCNLYLGRIDGDDYFRRAEAVEKQAPAALGKQLRFDRLCKQCFGAHDKDARNPFIAELQQLASELEADPDVPATTKVQVAQVRWLTQMATSSSAWITASTKPLLRASLGLPGITSSVEEAVKAAANAIDATYDELRLLRERTAQIGNPALMAESFIVGVLPIMTRFMTTLVITRIAGRSPVPVPDEIFTDIVAKLETAEKLFQGLGNDEGCSRVLLLLASWYDLNDRSAEAKDHASRLLALAQALGYDQKAREAENILAGQSEYRQLLSKILRPRDAEFFLASRTDEQLRRKALDVLDAMGLPSERLPIALKTMQGDRRLAIERTTWCKHMTLEGGASAHPTSPEYLTSDPIYRVYCLAWPFRTRIWSQDLDERIAWFKRVFCESCTDRCPKQNPDSANPLRPKRSK